MDSAAFGKTMENIRNHRNIKLVTTEGCKNFVESERNYHTAKDFLSIYH